MFSAMLFLLMISFMWFIWYLNLRAYNFWKVRGIAYVPAEKINSKKFLNSVLLSHRTLKKIYEAHKTELCCGFFQLRSPVLMIRSAKLVDRILNRDFKYFSDKRSSECINAEKDPLTQHLIGLSGHKWRYLRAKLSPTFTSGKLKAMFPLLHESVDVFLAKIDSSKGSPIDIKELCGKLSADIIVSYAFGIKINSLNGGGEQFLNMGKQAFGGDYWQMIKAHFRLLFPRLFKLFGFRGFSQDTTKFFCSFVKKSMEYRQKHNIHRYDFLHLLMKIQKEDSSSTKVKHDLEFTDELIAAQAFSFFIGGYETSSSTLCAALFEISRSKKVASLLYEEVHRALNSFGIISYETLTAMPYLQQVIDEVLRLHPPVFYLPRVCTEKYNIPKTNIEVEENIDIVIPVLEIHKDPNNFPKPENFDPDRFSPKNKHKIPHGAYIPFGEGPRKCIGMRFAILEVKLAVAKIISMYDMMLEKTMNENLEYEEFSRVYRIKGKVLIQFLRRFENSD